MGMGTTDSYEQYETSTDPDAPGGRRSNASATARHVQVAPDSLLPVRLATQRSSMAAAGQTSPFA
jgi:hypothetical protein